MDRYTTERLLEQVASVLGSTIDAQDPEYHAAVELLQRHFALAEGRAKSKMEREYDITLRVHMTVKER